MGKRTNRRQTSCGLWGVGRGQRHNTRPKSEARRNCPSHAESAGSAEDSLKRQMHLTTKAPRPPKAPLGILLCQNHFIPDDAP